MVNEYEDSETFEVEIKSEPDDEPAEVDPDDALGEPESESEEEIFYDEDATNLVGTFKQTEKGRKVLRVMADRFIEDFEGRYEATSELRERRKADWK